MSESSSSRLEKTSIASLSGESSQSPRKDQVLYSHLIEGLTEYAVFALSPRGLILSWNAGAEKTFGYTADEVLGKPFDIIFTAEDRASGAPQNELKTALNGAATQHDRWHVRKDETRFWGTNTIETLYDESHTFIGFTKLVRDTTANHLALQKVHDSEQEFRLLFESVKDYAIFSTALDGTIEKWNAGATALFGYDSTDMIGHNYCELFSSEDRANHVPEYELSNAATVGSALVERWMTRKDGSQFFGSGKLTQLNPDLDGAKRGFVKITHDMTELHAALEHERRWSTTFQRAVLPAGLPLITGLLSDAIYEPGSEDAQVGGDWYDTVRLPDGRILVAIGDVSGHGLEAAVVVGVIRQIVRGIAQLHADPALILDAADQALSLEYPDTYVTAWVAVLDQVMHTITYACAGHPPALLRGADGTLRELDQAHGLPVGLRGGRLGSAQTMPWLNGDTLVLYTDGLIEANRDILAGIARLNDVVGKLAFEAWDKPAEHIRHLVIPNGSPDDVAILVLRVDFALFERQVDRWSLDTLNAGAASALRSRFAASLPNDKFSAADAADAELVMGELIGNVVRHAGSSEADVAIDHSGPRTVVHVLDSGDGFSYISRLAPDLYSENGRGLFIIAAMTSDFHVDRRPDGGSHARAVLRDRSSVYVLQASK
jgi:PAS domain S-box-containing protein